MFAHLPHRGPHPHAVAWQAAISLRRLAAALAAVICTGLASAAQARRLPRDGHGHQPGARPECLAQARSPAGQDPRPGRASLRALTTPAGKRPDPARGVCAMPGPRQTPGPSPTVTPKRPSRSCGGRALRGGARGVRTQINLIRVTPMVTSAVCHSVPNGGAARAVPRAPQITQRHRVSSPASDRIAEWGLRVVPVGPGQGRCISPCSGVAMVWPHPGGRVTRSGAAAAIAGPRAWWGRCTGRSGRPIPGCGFRPGWTAWPPARHW